MRTLPSREQIIIPLVRGKRVLDCGGIDHYAADAKFRDGDWLHATIAEHASECIGVDILEVNVHQINNQGRFQFVTANVEELDFREAFDVVLAGEVVEHLFNMGRFLDSAWRALRPGGRLVITTPNAYGFTPQFKNLIRGKEGVHPEHTCYYSEKTLTFIVSRHGFHVDVVHFVTRPASHPWIAAARRVVEAARPSMADKVVLVGTKQDAQLKHTGMW